jgi:dienelactone hydrolase
MTRLQAWLKRREELQAIYVHCIGGFPDRCDLAVEVTDQQATEQFEAQWLRFSSETGERVPGLFVKPRDREGPFPVIVALPGGHRTKDLTIFGHEQWPLPFQIESPHHRFPVEKLGNNEPLPYTHFLDHGFALMSIDARVFGARATERPDSSIDRGAFTAASWQQYHLLMRRALTEGRSAAAMEVWDIIRTIDYLATRNDVDADRIGCMGFSMGGNLSWMAGIIEPRIKAACTVSCLITFDAALEHGRDGGWYAWIPGIGKHTARQELFSMMAPRPLISFEGDDDFPPEARQPMIDEARTKYELFGAADKFRSVVYDGGHGACLRNKATLKEIGRWFQQHLALQL